MRRNKGSLVVALILIVLGVWYLLAEIYPPLTTFAYGLAMWPWQIIGFGGLLVLVGLLTWIPGLVIPGIIVSGIGAILYFQNRSGEWASWAYAWTALPGIVGVSLLAFGTLVGRRGALLAGFWNVVASLILFGIFGSVFGALRYGTVIWPLGLILLGIYFILRFFVPRRPKV